MNSVVGAIICEQYYLNHKSSSHDSTFATWKTVLSTSGVQNASIITACVPCIKPFLKSLETGMMRSRDLRPGQGHYFQMDKYNPYKSSGVSSSPNSRARPLNGGRNLDSPIPNSSAYAVTVPSHAHEKEYREPRKSSQAIRATRTWAVDVVEGSSHPIGGTQVTHV